MAGQAKHSILVVDDEPQMLFSLEHLLRRDFDVHVATSGQEGMRVLEQHPVHVVMTDQRMPQMTGVEFLTRIKHVHPEAIRIIFTGFADVSAVIEAINQGNIFRYVTKPWDPEDLIRVLHEACAQYNRIVEQQALLTDLRAFELRCISLAEGVRNGRLGQLHESGIAEAISVANDGRELLARIDRVLKHAPAQP